MNSLDDTLKGSYLVFSNIRLKKVDFFLKLF